MINIQIAGSLGQGIGNGMPYRPSWTASAKPASAPDDTGCVRASAEKVKVSWVLVILTSLGVIVRVIWHICGVNQDPGLE